MRIAQPKPFFFERGKRAVLLLHGFTGTSADVRMLGRFLEKEGYTSLAPHYKGHGVPPEELIHTGPEEWWEDVLAGYNQLQEAGYDEIAVAGLSLGGVFSLKLGYNKPVKGIVTMCAPMSMRTTDIMYEGVLKYAREYKKFEGKDEEDIESEVEVHYARKICLLSKNFVHLFMTSEIISIIFMHRYLLYKQHKMMIDTDSANVIYDNTESEKTHEMV